MRILYIITANDPVGGAMVHVTHMAHRVGSDGTAGHAEGEGHRTRVIVGRNSSQSQSLLRSYDVEYEVVESLMRPISPLVDLRAVRDLRRSIRRFRPDLVSTHSTKAGLVGRLAARLEGVPVLFTAHGWAFTEGAPRRRIYRTVERVLQRLTNRIICVSDYDRQLAVRSGFDPNRLVTIHNGMPDLVEEPDEEERAPIEALPDARTRAVMVARFSRQKDHALLLQAASDIPDLDLVFLGQGELEGEIRTLAEDLGMGGRVHFLGYSRYVPWILSKMDLFCLISNYEGFPRSTIEAMARGLPVVVSDVGGAAEAVEDGVNGFVIPRGDIGLLRARLKDLIREPDLRRSMGEASSVRYRESYTLDALVARTLALYRDVVGLSAPRKGTS
jgi:glycosyltransferase involved in cell wall biosynthesis